ncbi:MAG: PepSY domain-containing protein, partial [Candidatus Competibacterales bacterium]
MVEIQLWPLRSIASFVNAAMGKFVMKFNQLVIGTILGVFILLPASVAQVDEEPENGSVIFQIQNIIGIDQVIGIAQTTSPQGQVIAASLIFEEGIPSYEVIIDEINQFRTLHINPETGAVVLNETEAFNEPAFVPSVSLTEALFQANQAFPGQVLEAELKAAENSSVYQIFTLGEEDIVALTISGDTGNPLVVTSGDAFRKLASMGNEEDEGGERDEDEGRENDDDEDGERDEDEGRENDDDEDGERDGDNFVDVISVSAEEAVTAAEQATSGSAEALSLDFDVNGAFYAIELVANGIEVEALVDANSAEVFDIRNNPDEDQAFIDALAATDNLIAIDTALASATTAQAGQVIALELELAEDQSLNYCAKLLDNNQLFKVTIDGITGNVTNSGPLDGREEDDAGDEDEIRDEDDGEGERDE